MLSERIRGCLILFLGLLIGINLGLFWLWWWMEAQYGYFGILDYHRLELYFVPLPVVILSLTRHYRQIFEQIQHPSWLRSFGISMRLNIVLGLAFIFVYFALKDVGLSRLFITYYLIVSWVANGFALRFIPQILARVLFPDSTSTPAVIFANGSLPSAMVAYIKRSSRLGVRYVGYYSDRRQGMFGLEWLGPIDDVLRTEGGRKRVRVEQVLGYAEKMSDETFLEVIDRCLSAGTRVQIFSNFSSVFADPVRITMQDNVPLLTFFDEPLQNPMNVALKRGLDLLISGFVVLCIIPPLTALVWLMQRIQSPGPVFYRQIRHGMGRKTFPILKYRSMHLQNASGNAVHQVGSGDHRVYPFGAILRRTSLDELPQFINVLWGSMSVVGPRPHLTDHDDIFEKEFRRYRTRQFVKPGITGLAQVSGYRGATPTGGHVINRVRKDIEYITNWTLRLEIRIILQTAIQMLRPPRAAR